MLIMETFDYHLLVLNRRTYNWPDFRQFPLASVNRKIYYKKYKKLVMNLIDRPLLYSKYDVCNFDNIYQLRPILIPNYNNLPPVYSDIYYNGNMILTSLNIELPPSYNELYPIISN